MTSDVSWLVTAPRSGKVIVIAPGQPAGADDAVARIDAELGGATGAEPSWFTALQKLGYWWYAICIAVGILVLLLVSDASVALRVGSGIGVGIVLAVVSSLVLGTIARAQARSGTSADTTPSALEAGGVARLAWGTIPEQVTAILTKDPALDERVHVRAWRAARATTPDGQDALEELTALWTEADPHAASAQDAEVERMKQAIREANRREG